MIQCPNGHEVSDNVKFCPTCGAAIVRVNKYCAKCGNKRKGTEKFCTQCGTPFDGVPTSQPSPSYDDRESSSNSKKILIPIAVGVLILALIGGGWWFFIGNKSNEPFETAIVSFKKTVPSDNFDVTAEINIDYPQKGNPELKEKVIDFILKALKEDFTFEEPSQNPVYEGDKYDGQAVVNFYGEAKIKEFQKAGIGDVSFNIKKDAETEKFISYRLDMGGSAGGVGIGLSYGTSFNKSDGSIIQVIKDPNESGFKDFLISHVKNHLRKEDSIKQLFEYELNDHPYPKKAPYLSKDGICFIYQKYEIGTGAMGEVEFIIPYDEMRPFMSELALSVVDADVNVGQNVQNIEDNVSSKEQITKRLEEIFEDVARGNAKDCDERYFSSDFKKIYKEVADIDERFAQEGSLGFWDFTFWEMTQGEGIMSVDIKDVYDIKGKEATAKLSFKYSFDNAPSEYKNEDIKVILENGKWVLDDLHGYKKKMKDFYEEYKDTPLTQTESSTNDYQESASNSTPSRTFYSEQIVIGYLANQTFRASDGLTMRIDGGGRLYVDGDYAGVLSVLRYSSTAALLRYSGGLYGEGKLSVQIVGDKFQLTDPVDGTVYYQR